MNFRNMAAAMLMITATWPLFARDNITPQYSSGLNAEERQAQSRQPFSATEVKTLQQPNESNHNQLVVRNTHIVMLSEQGVTVLQRTENGLVKQYEAFFEGLAYSGGKKVFASPDGKTVIWTSNSAFIELKIHADFSASHKKLEGFAQPDFISPYSTSDSFVSYSNQTNTQIAYQVTNSGLTMQGELHAGMDILNSSLYYNSKDQILVSFLNYYSNGLSVVAFKQKDGKFIETGRQYLNTNQLSNYPVYDIDNSRFVIQNDSKKYHDIKINSFTGAIDSVKIASKRLVELNDFSGIVSDEYFTTDIYGTNYLLQRDGDSFRQRAKLEPFSATTATYFNNETGHQEYWQNSAWSLLHSRVYSNWIGFFNELNVNYRGFPKLYSSMMLSSDDNNYVLVQDGNYKALLAVKNNTLEAVYSTEISEKHKQASLNSKFIHLEDDKYLIADSNSYNIVYYYRGSSYGWVSMTESKPWPESIGYLPPDAHLKFKDGYILLANRGLTVLQLNNESLSVVQTFDDAALSEKEHRDIRAVVELNGRLFALMPESEKIARLVLKDGKLSVDKTASMPLATGPYREGNNRVYAGNYKGSVLMPDTNENLQIMSVAAESQEGFYYKKRFKISSQFNNNQTLLMQNDDISGEWQKTELSGDCCEPNVGLRIIGQHLLSFDNESRQNIKIFKINSAPYLPEKINPLQFNQGVVAEIDISTLMRDDEDQSIRYSGLSTVGFTLTDDNKLKFDGISKGNGTLTLTASDGELLTELRLPYQINAAPTLLKTIPTITANQNTQFIFDLNDYIADPEGSSLNFQTQTQNGLTLNSSGQISGTISSVQNVTFALKVTDKAGATLNTRIVVQVNSAPTLTGSAGLSAKVGERFTIDLNALVTDAENHKISFTTSTLPAGLNINGTVISGTPTSAGLSEIQLTATDEQGARNTLTLSLSIAAEDKKSGGSLGLGWLVLLLLTQVHRRYSNQ